MYIYWRLVERAYSIKWIMQFARAIGINAIYDAIAQGGGEDEGRCPRERARRRL